MTNNKHPIILRPTFVSDLDHFFQFQLDEEASYQAAFMPKDPTDKTAYLTKHTKLLGDPTVNDLTIMAGDVIIGVVGKFVMHGDAEITYCLDRSYWGKGIGTKSLQDFLAIETTRPLLAGWPLTILAHKKSWKTVVLSKLAPTGDLPMPDKQR